MKESKAQLSARHVLARNVRRLREQQGLSQERLAEAAGFHRTYVSQIERAVLNIAIDNIERLALRLGVEPRVLLDARPLLQQSRAGEDA
jgi:transcriptional regulator with XRE-family HTH domain